MYGMGLAAPSIGAHDAASGERRPPSTTSHKLQSRQRPRRLNILQADEGRQGVPTKRILGEAPQVKRRLADLTPFVAQAIAHARKLERAPSRSRTRLKIVQQSKKSHAASTDEKNTGTQSTCPLDLEDGSCGNQARRNAKGDQSGVDYGLEVRQGEGQPKMVGPWAGTGEENTRTETLDLADAPSKNELRRKPKRDRAGKFVAFEAKNGRRQLRIVRARMGTVEDEIGGERPPPPCLDDEAHRKSKLDRAGKGKRQLKIVRSVASSVDEEPKNEKGQNRKCEVQRGKKQLKIFRVRASTSEKETGNDRALRPHLEDAPVGHEAHRKAKLDRAGKVVTIEYEQADGRKDVLQTTVCVCDGSVSHALRIARLCYLKFEEGAPKHEVLHFRNRLYRAHGFKVPPRARNHFFEPPPSSNLLSFGVKRCAGLSHSEGSCARREESDRAVCGATPGRDVDTEPAVEDEAIAGENEAHAQVQASRSMDVEDGDEERSTKLLADAPAGHEAFKMVSIGRNRAFFRFRMHDVPQIYFQTMASACGGCVNAAARVCRLCYVKFAEGQSKDEVLSFRDSICRQYDTAPAARCSDEVEDDAPKDHEAHMKVKLHTRNNFFACEMFAADGKVRIQVTVLSCQGDACQAARICRLCYVKLAEGLSKAQVLDFRNRAIERLKNKSMQAQYGTLSFHRMKDETAVRSEPDARDSDHTEAQAPLAKVQSAERKSAKRPRVSIVGTRDVPPEEQPTSPPPAREFETVEKSTAPVSARRSSRTSASSGRKSGSKPEGCHAKERAVQAPHVDPLEERYASWIGQQDRPSPSQSSSALWSDLRAPQPEDLQPRRAWAQLYEWLEDWSRARCDEMSQWAVLVTGPPGTGKTAGVRLLASRVRGTFLECDMREVEGRKLVELILKGQGGQGLRQTSVAILNIDTDATDGLKWRLCKAAQQSQIPLIFVCDDGVVTARDELVQKCLCLEVRHKPQNVEQALRRVTQRNGLNMAEACLSIAIACGHDVRKAINTAQLLGQRSSSSELPTAALSASAACHQLLLPSDTTDVPEVLELLEQGGEELCRALQRQYLTSCGESFETLDQCAFAAEAMALGDVAECAASHTAWAEDTSDSTTNGFYLGAVSALRKRRCHHSAQACPMESPQTIQVSAALIATLSAETGLPKVCVRDHVMERVHACRASSMQHIHLQPRALKTSLFRYAKKRFDFQGRLGQPLDRSQSRGAQDGGLLVTNSSPTELASKVVAQDDTDELDRTWEDQDERRWADERRTSNAENEVEGELVRGDGHGENRLEASTNEEDVGVQATNFTAEPASKIVADDDTDEEEQTCQNQDERREKEKGPENVEGKLASEDSHREHLEECEHAAEEDVPEVP